MMRLHEERRLIVNADDFGQSAGINRGIMKAHEEGIVTSASLMVRWPAAVEAAEYARRRPGLSLGLHFDFGEWRYGGETWRKVYDVVDEDDLVAVRKEAIRQIARFHRLTGGDPTHFDSHQHIHLRSRLTPCFAELAAQYGIPLRSCRSNVSYYGGFYGQDEKGQSFPACIGVHALVGILVNLAPGFTELGCHPGYTNGLDTAYGYERGLEVASLCDPSVRNTIDDQGIALCSFREVHETARSAAGGNN